MRFNFLDRLLGSLGGKKKKKKGKGRPKGSKTAAPKPRAQRSPAPAEREGPDEIFTMDPPLEVTIPAAEASVAVEATTLPLMEAPSEPLAPEPTPPREVIVAAVAEAPVSEALEALQRGDADAIARLLAPARGVLGALEDKRAVFASYQAQLERAIASRDFMTLSFVGSSLIVDSAFMRDDLVAMAERLAAKSEQFASLSGKKAQAAQGELAELFEAFRSGAAKKVKLIESLDGKLIKAHQAKDLASLADMTGALARDALILASVAADAQGPAASEQTGLTATSASEKAAMLNQQVAQLHQAVLDQRYQTISDVARIVSLNAGVLADPSTYKAAQILQLGQQLQQGMRSTPEHPSNLAVCANLAKIASVFNGPLMDKAGQLEGQVQQLQAAIAALDHNKMFTMAVTIARSASILTDSTVQKASLLAGYVPRVEISLKRKDFSGAASALKSALS